MRVPPSFEGTPRAVPDKTNMIARGKHKLRLCALTKPFSALAEVKWAGLFFLFDRQALAHRWCQMYKISTNPYIKFALWGSTFFFYGRQAEICRINLTVTFSWFPAETNRPQIEKTYNIMLGISTLLSSYMYRCANLLQHFRSAAITGGAMQIILSCRIQLTCL
jgi:hypothetical protein